MKIRSMGLECMGGALVRRPGDDGGVTVLVGNAARNVYRSASNDNGPEVRDKAAAALINKMSGTRVVPEARDLV